MAHDRHMSKPARIRQLFIARNKLLCETIRVLQVKAAEDFRKLSENDDSIGQMIRTAKRLEGSVRNTGIHACGVIITPDDITKYVPVTTAKDSDLLVTQFDNSVVESAGLLKMDFLGLKTLTIIKDAVEIIKNNDKYDVNLPYISNDQYFEIIDIKSQIDLSIAAELAEIDLNELYTLNAGFNRWATSPDGPNRLLIPKNKANPFEHITKEKRKQNSAPAIAKA